MDKRSPNFTGSEVDFLLEVVKKYSQVIECKKTDRMGAEEKLKAWKDVERDFNCKFTHTFRNYKVLKTKYSNIKATAKQNFATEKRQTYATGGGPQQSTAVTKTDETILEICQESQILGKPSCYDCDVNENEFANYEILECSFGEEVAVMDMTQSDKVDDVKEEIKDYKTWDKYTPKNLKKPLHKSLRKKEKDSVRTDAWMKVAEVKLEKQKLEIEFLRERQALEVEKLKLEVEYIRLKLNKLKSE